MIDLLAKFPTMSRSQIFILFVLALLQPSAYGSGAIRETRSIESRVIGGRPANPGEFPYQLQLRVNNWFACGATLVMSPNSETQIVITAAHCVTDRDSTTPVPESTVTLRAAITAINETGPSRSVQKIIVHPQYSLLYGVVPINDIAVLLINRNFRLSNKIKPLDLPVQGQETTENVTLSGWGRTNTASIASADTLQAVDLPIVDSTICNDLHVQGLPIQVIFDTNLCAGTETAEISGCHGDSGGPARGVSNELKPYLAGVVSWGDGNCEKNPSVFVRVSSYVDWIGSVSP